MSNRNPQRTDPEVHATLFPARARYVPRSFGASGVCEMMDVVDAMKMIAIVTGTAAHTLRTLGSSFARKAGINAVRIAWSRVW